MKSAVAGERWVRPVRYHVLDMAKGLVEGGVGSYPTDQGIRLCRAVWISLKMRLKTVLETVQC